MSTLRKLLNPAPKRPLDLAKIRASGVQISALASSHLRILEELNKQYELLAEELTKADPSSEEGKEFEQLFLALNRVFVRVAGTHEFIHLGYDLKEFRREQQESVALVKAASRVEVLHVAKHA